jgi:hypothetical protein
VVCVNRHDHRARNLRHCRRIPIGKHSNSGSKYASSPAKTNTQTDPTANRHWFKAQYFSTANLSMLVKTQTDLTVNLNWGGGNPTNTNASLKLDTTPTCISTDCAV